jgi:hypothetical protein
MFKPEFSCPELVRCLQALGVVSPLRAKRLIKEMIKSLGLDLSDLVVLTEAASRNYVYTPIIAAMAGSPKVYAFTRDSRYGSIPEVQETTGLFAALCNVANRVEIITEKTSSVVSEADIVTNLGFVRPIDQEMVKMMKPTAVVPLMCEAWEFRPGDVDLAACRAKGISVLGTDEDTPGVDVFSYSGWLCQKMLFDAQIEIYKSKIVLVSSDKFGCVIEQQLRRAGIWVRLVPSLGKIDEEELASADAVVVADYSRDGIIIGQNGDITASYLARVTPSVTVIQFAGRVDVSHLKEYGIRVYPGIELSAHHMGLTLAGLGPRPVIELHTAGLRVAQWAHEMKRAGIDLSNASGLWHDTLAQFIGDTR